MPSRGEERGSGGWRPHNPLVPESSAFSKTVTTANTGWGLGTPGRALRTLCTRAAAQTLCPYTSVPSSAGEGNSRSQIPPCDELHHNHGPRAEDADGLFDTKKLLLGLLQARGLGNDNKARKVSSNISILSCWFLSFEPTACN